MKRFYFEGFIGFLMLFGTYFVGQQSLLALVLMALLPIYVKKYNQDLTKNQLIVFYKIHNSSVGIIVLTLFIIFSSSQFQFGIGKVGEMWLPISISSILIIHSLLGIIFFVSSKGE